LEASSSLRFRPPLHDLAPVFQYLLPVIGRVESVLALVREATLGNLTGTLLALHHDLNEARKPCGGTRRSRWFDLTGLIGRLRSKA
jgi:hypothetical protein